MRVLSATSRGIKVGKLLNRGRVLEWSQNRAGQFQGVGLAVEVGIYGYYESSI